MVDLTKIFNTETTLKLQTLNDFQKLLLPDDIKLKKLKKK